MPEFAGGPERPRGIRPGVGVGREMILSDQRVAAPLLPVVSCVLPFLVRWNLMASRRAETLWLPLNGLGRNVEPGPRGGHRAVIRALADGHCDAAVVRRRNSGLRRGHWQSGMPLGAWGIG